MNQNPERFSSTSWTASELNRVWSFGYSHNQISRNIHSLPCALKLSLDRAFISLRRVLEASLDSSKSETSGWCKDIEDYHECFPDFDVLMHCCTVGLDSYESKGLLIITFDTSTQTRNKIIANETMAKMHCMGLNEFLSKLSENQLTFPSPDLDAISVYLHAMLSDLPSPGSPRVRYMRLCNKTGSMLLRWTMIFILNNQGMVVEVRTVPL